MSGIYIKGMEMPKNCYDCDLCYDLIACNDLDEGFSHRADGTFSPRKKRLPNCPLIEVPQHGRLIDADTLAERMDGLKQQAMADGFDLGEFWYAAFVQHIKLSPTIIPADEEVSE